MKLYAIRDRLIDYYLRPFAAEGDKEVMASLAETINNVENKAPIAQTPSHFELWRLAEVDQESGLVVPARELIADCAALARPGLRETVEQRRAAIDRAARGGEGETGGVGGPARANGGPLQDNAQAGGGATRQAYTADPGSSEIARGRDGKH